MGEGFDMPSNKRQIILRFDDYNVYEKIKVIADLHRRSATAEIETILSDYIKRYEKRYGKIKIEEGE